MTLKLYVNQEEQLLQNEQQGVLSDLVELHRVLLDAVQAYTKTHAGPEEKQEAKEDQARQSDGERLDSGTVEEAVAVEEIDSEHECRCCWNESSETYGNTAPLMWKRNHFVPFLRAISTDLHGHTNTDRAWWRHSPRARETRPRDSDRLCDCDRPTKLVRLRLVTLDSHWQ